MVYEMLFLLNIFYYDFKYVTNILTFSHTFLKDKLPDGLDAKNIV